MQSGEAQRSPTGRPSVTVRGQTSNTSLTRCLVCGWLVTESVGPFRVTGFKPAVAHLRASLNKVQARKPALFAALGSAGMLAVRHVRGYPKVASNHSFGMAIDFTINGKLDQMGDNMVMRGSLELYSILKEDLWYWLGAARREDGMHWEPSAQLIQKWIAQGLL